MLVNSVVIVLREVLEATLLISVLLAVSRRMELHRQWLAAAFFAGLLGALAYAGGLAFISDLFDGTGQELTNAALQSGIVLSLIVCVFHIAKNRGRFRFSSRLFSVAMAIAVAFAVVHEGSEIVIYVSGFLRVEQFVSDVGIGSMAGLGIGVSIGVLFYYFLLALPEVYAFWVGIVLLGFAGSSMAIQATQLLAQADIISLGPPVWDTSALIAEGSPLGELLYALIGYEATPSLTEVVAYVTVFLAIGLSAVVGLTVQDALDGHPA